MAEDKKETDSQELNRKESQVKKGNILTREFSVPPHSQAIILIIIGVIFIAAVILMGIASSTDSSLDPTSDFFDSAIIGFIGIMLLVPGLILLISGIKLLGRQKNN